MSVPTTSPPPAELNLSLAHGCLGLAAVSLVASVLLSLADQYTPVVITRGMFAILAALIVVGVLGCLTQVALGQLRRGQLAVIAEISALRRELAALRAAPCRAAGRMHVSQPRQPQAGAGSTSVDGATDPVGVLQRAREVGIEEGFDLGLKVKLADLGVPTLPRPRKPRLTRDS